VAILARRDGRAQLLGRLLMVPNADELRSSPGAMAGRSRFGASRCAAIPFVLRSSPGAMAGRSIDERVEARIRRQGAILARRDGRAQPTPGSDSFDAPSRLRSSPGAMAGRSAVTRRMVAGDRGCDPRPARWPGAAPSSTQIMYRLVALRSSPGAMAG